MTEKTTLSKSDCHWLAALGALATFVVVVKAMLSAEPQSFFFILFSHLTMWSGWSFIVSSRHQAWLNFTYGQAGKSLKRRLFFTGVIENLVWMVVSICAQEWFTALSRLPTFGMDHVIDHQIVQAKDVIALEEGAKTRRSPLRSLLSATLGYRVLETIFFRRNRQEAAQKWLWHNYVVGFGAGLVNLVVGYLAIRAVLYYVDPKDSVNAAHAMKDQLSGLGLFAGIFSLSVWALHLKELRGPEGPEKVKTFSVLIPYFILISASMWSVQQLCSYMLGKGFPLGVGGMILAGLTVAVHALLILEVRKLRRKPMFAYSFSL